MLIEEQQSYQEQDQWQDSRNSKKKISSQKRKNTIFSKNHSQSIITPTSKKKRAIKNNNSISYRRINPKEKYLKSIISQNPKFPMSPTLLNSNIEIKSNLMSIPDYDSTNSDYNPEIYEKNQNFSPRNNYSNRSHLKRSNIDLNHPLTGREKYNTNNGRGQDAPLKFDMRRWTVNQHPLDSYLTKNQEEDQEEEDSPIDIRE